MTITSPVCWYNAEDSAKHSNPSCRVGTLRGAQCRLRTTLVTNTNPSEIWSVSAFPSLFSDMEFHLLTTHYEQMQEASQRQARSPPPIPRDPHFDHSSEMAPLPRCPLALDFTGVNRGIQARAGQKVGEAALCVVRGRAQPTAGGNLWCRWRSARFCTYT